jgi:23S rRNA C2498 (ribose-2'-O)-methylase RlmM
MRELMLVARPDYGGALHEESVRRFGGGSAVPLHPDEPGVVRLTGDAVPRAWREGRNTLIFAAQWLSDPELVPAAEVPHRSMIEGLSALAGGVAPWTLHAFASGRDTEEGLYKAAGRLGDALLAACAEQVPDLYRRFVPPRKAGAEAKVFQLCLTAKGAWWSLMQVRDLLDPFPGGEHRMPFDSAAPCRSYLKLEEAFDIMGKSPRKGDRVVDLGASPGGWSYAFLKRGCEVLAVDRGPMQIPDRHSSGGRVRHMRVDGVGFHPPREWDQVDWLACDMLVPPGATMGLLRRWLEEGRVRRFVVNFKMPQQHPDPILEPIEEMLNGIPRLRFRIRQLYHDRREVTAMGEVK